VVQYSDQDTVAPLEIHIYPGHDGKFVMTEDDGTTYNYINGDVRLTTYTWSDATKILSWRVEGKYTGKKVFKTIMVICGNEIKTAAIHNKGSVTFR
ncbi:MAG: DUF5110 domain-containing protein, partial [Bacteroidota bacterium]|nr:DUF5110 domain-containing protein [Bacteroidota bacterium]